MVQEGAFDEVSGARQLQLQGNMLHDMHGTPFFRLSELRTLDLQRFAIKCFPLFPRLLHYRTASFLTASAVFSTNDVQDDDDGYDAPSFMNIASYFSDIVAPPNDEMRLGLCGFVSMADAPGTCGCTFETTEQGTLFRHGNCSLLCQAFDLSDSGIKSIDAGAFQFMQTLRMLVLAQNGVAQINASDFSDNVRLQMLDISGNKIDHIAPTTFRSLRVLSHLILARNRLQDVSDTVFCATYSPGGPRPAAEPNRAERTAGFVAGAEGAQAQPEQHNAPGRAPARPQHTRPLVRAFAETDRLLSLNLSHSGVTDVEADAFTGLSSMVRVQRDLLEAAMAP